MNQEIKLNKKAKTLLRACHICTKISESQGEIEKCQYCQKSFLPLRYFDKIHASPKKDWSSHFSDIQDLEEKDLIKGLFVMW